MTLRFLTAGESHGPQLTVILEGIPAGLPISSDAIDIDLARRQTGYGAGPRMKIEKDHAEITAGVMNGCTSGAPIAIQIANRDHSKWLDKAIPAYTSPRPGHADLPGVLKYGHEDIRPVLERASARETAARVAAGSICRQFLATFSIEVFGWVRSIGSIYADLDPIPLEKRAEQAAQNAVNCPDPAAAELMIAEIRNAMEQKDTLGGILEACVRGVPAGLGSYVQWDRRLDARLAAAVLSIQAIKGMEIGEAFINASLAGTAAHDAIHLEGDHLVRASNRAGGIEGGMSNGQPILVRAAMKPIATTLSPQNTVDFATGKETPTTYERSDFCPVPRAVVILESMLAFVIADALIEKLGGDSIQEMIPRFNTLPMPNLKDIRVNNSPKSFWQAEG